MADNNEINKKMNEQNSTKNLEIKQVETKQVETKQVETNMEDQIKIINKHELEGPKELLNVPLEQLRFVQKEDADVPLTILKVKENPKNSSKSLITIKETLNPRASYLLKDGQHKMSLDPSMTSIVFSVVIAAALINNYVFTKYLGLCVFFGTSKRRDTAIGMGVTFTVVAVLSAFISFLLQQGVLSPLKLNFLQILVFIGTVAFLVQASDTILRKIQPTLHRKFGIYIVLITTNCIILAVPLLNAAAHSGFWESMGHAIGAGLGFALALFLMSCSREKAEVAPIPLVFKGLPIAFIIAGLFALSFLGFSGLKIL